MKYLNFIFFPFIILVFCFTFSLSFAKENIVAPPGTDFILAPVSDPLEPYNRSVQSFNEIFLESILLPFSRAYTFIIPSPVRSGIHNASQNLLYPVRGVNCLLQGKGSDFYTESQRFFINSTIGFAGIRDQATRWGISPVYEDFGQTLAFYNCPPGFYFNLPLLGPSNVRDTCSMLADFPLSLSFWLFSNNTAWAVNTVAGVNDASENAETMQQILSSQLDGYIFAKAFYSIEREVLSQDYMPELIEGNPEQSLGYLFLQPKNKNFIKTTRRHKVKLAASKSALPYNCWPVKNSRGIILLLPGLGGHRNSTGVLALAELFNSAGWSVLALSSSLNPDYFANLPVNHAPGFFREDSKIQAIALKAAVEDMEKNYKLRNQERNVVGFSLGAINSLFLAALDENEKAGLNINKYMAINPPVDLMYALEQIDVFFNIPLTWQEDEREARSKELFFKTFALLGSAEEIMQRQSIPLTYEESCFLIGLNMRLSLAETIIASQQKLNQDFLINDPNAFNKNLLWKEVLSLTFSDYMEKSVIPYYLKFFPDKGEELGSWLLQESNLFAIEKQLREKENVFVLQNANDFLISEEILPWYKETFAERAIILPEGGHLGNMYLPEYQQLLLKLLEK